MATPHTLENSMRAHDAAVYTWLGGIRFDYGIINGDDYRDHPVLRVFAAPQRVAATVVDLLLRTGWIQGTSRDDMLTKAKANFAVLPLPIVSIRRQDPALAPELAGTAKTFRSQRFDEAAGTLEQHGWPGAYRTTYELTLWCKRRAAEVHFREWLYGRLGKGNVNEHELLIPVVHVEPWGTINQSARYEGGSDLSELEGDNQLYYRFAHTLNLTTWVFRNPGSVKPVESAAPTVLVTVPEFGVKTTLEDAVTGATVASPTGLNAFRIPYSRAQIPLKWATAGNAKVRAVEKSPLWAASSDGLRVDVTAASDEVPLSIRPIRLDVDGAAVLSVSADYHIDGTPDATNFVRAPEDLTSLKWLKRGDTVATRDVAADPFDGFGAGIVLAGASGAEGVEQELWNVGGSTVTASVYLRQLDAGDVVVRLEDGSGGDEVTHTLTTGWTRVSVTRTFGASPTAVKLIVRPSNQASALQFFVFGVRSAVEATAASYVPLPGAVLRVWERDVGGVWIDAARWVLRQHSDWKSFHQFALVRSAQYQVAVTGRGVAVQASLSGVDVRHVFTTTPFQTPTASGVSAALGIQFEFGLAALRPYLLLYEPAEGVVSRGVVAFDLDGSGVSRYAGMDTETHRALVLSVASADSEVQVVLNPSPVKKLFRLIPYAGNYRGSSV